MDRSEIQKKAVEKWLQSGKKGTLEISTGVGKTIASLLCLYELPKDRTKHYLFIAETTSRKKDLIKDIEKFNELFGVDVIMDYNLVFKTYQSVYKLENIDICMAICDEIHFAMTPEYSKFFTNNNIEHIVGLSATIDRATTYETSNGYLSKGYLIDQIAPVCFTYDINQATSDGVARKIDIYVIHNKLDNFNKNVKAGSAKKSFFQTEEAAYRYWDAQHRRSWFIEDLEQRNLKIRITASKRSKLLFNLPHKAEVVKKLLKALKGKTIVFGNSLDSVLAVTKNTVSSRKDDVLNDQIREKFDKGEINVIGSFKKLLQGANLKELDNVVVMSYYGKEKNIVQQLGRLRKNGDKIGSGFILLTDYTQEEIWFTKMMQNLEVFNIIHCDSVEDCINKYELKHER